MAVNSTKILLSNNTQKQTIPLDAEQYEQQEQNTIVTVKELKSEGDGETVIDSDNK